MGHRDALRQWWGVAAIAAIALLILATSFCCLDRDGMDHHAVPMGLCSVAVVISVAGLAGMMLLLLGLSPTPGREAFATIPLAVPKPPPRPIRLS